MLIENKRIGISEEDINNEVDIFKLKNWQFEIGKDLVSIKYQLHSSYKAEGDYTQEETKWYRNAKYAMELQKLLSRKINDRIEFLYYKSREANPDLDLDISGYTPETDILEFEDDR